VRSSSSLTGVSIQSKLKEAATFLTGRFSTRNSQGDTFAPLLSQLEDYRAIYENLTGRSLDSARIFEIGYGQRPLKLEALISMGLDASGIDLDMPMLHFSLSKLYAISQENGLERALKTGVRSILFDGKERADLNRSLQLRGYNLRIDPSRFFVGNAASFTPSGGTIDLVYSEDVFEHIPREQLKILVEHLATQLSPHGLALIRPNIFTGITGSHLLEWYAGQVDREIPRSSEPWEHLRKRRFTANTYLNEMTRADYRALFGTYFDILEERVQLPDLGRKWLTPELKEELAAWNDEELFSNRVLFVLRRKSA
jgi:hypothetical protein